MKRPRSWIPVALVALVALAAIVVPGIAGADFVCPLCSSAPVNALGTGEVVELVLSTLLRKGIAVLFLGVTAVVSLPWLAAGIVAATFPSPPWHVLKRLRAWW